ncbi:unnamed protein product, partial [marine sediment metagenome]
GETALDWGTVKEYPSGIVDAPGQSRARAFKAALQIIAPFTQTKVLLDTITFDNHNEFDEITNHRFTAIEAGYYLAVAQIRWDGGCHLVSLSSLIIRLRICGFKRYDLINQA